MEIKQLKYFIALSKHQNITAVAKEQFISQQAVSKSIQKFEQELDVALFDRSVHGMTLTEYGKCLLPYAKKILRDTAAAEKAISDLKNNNFLSIQIGYTFGSYHADSAIPPLLLYKWETKNRNAAIFVQESGPEELIEMVEQEDVDLAYVIGSCVPESKYLTVIPLQSEQWYILGKKSLITDNMHKNLSRDILIAKIGHDGTQEIKQLYKSTGIKPHFRYYNGLFNQIIERVRIGEGILISGKSFCEAHQEKGMVSFPFPNTDMCIQHNLIYKKNRNMSDAVRSLIDEIQKEVKNRQ